MKGCDKVPNRILKESICRSEEIDSLSWFEEVLFYRLIVICDDYGRYDGRTKIIKGSCFPLKDVTEKDIEKSLKKLSAVGLVRVYEAQGRPYLQLVTWENHQNVRAKKSKYPAYDGTCIQMYANENECPRNPIQYESISESQSTISDDIVRPAKTERKDEIQTVIDSWNQLKMYGIPFVSTMSSKSKRCQMLNARLNEFGLDKVLEAMERIKNSDFLKGKNSTGWVITFDWFVKPNNFPKVLEGNYDNKGINSQNHYGNRLNELTQESRGDLSG